MARILISVLLAVGLAVPSRAWSVELPHFFQELADESLGDRRSFIAERFHTLCTEQGLAPTNDENLTTFHEVLFFHDLLTTTTAMDCATGGLLDIPYFWHWVDPNPRHEILLLPDSVALATVPPPAPYRRYQTMADIDRVPAFYLGDLVTDRPRYAHPDCGQFFTFGWCSEREMAYSALMRLLGYTTKVVQSGIHTWSSVWCVFRDVDGHEKVLEAIVDNTFDFVRWEPVPAGLSLPEWTADVGEGTQIRWYNQQARSLDQLAALRAIEVSEVATARIRTRIVRSRH